MKTPPPVGQSTAPGSGQKRKAVKPIKLWCHHDRKGNEIQIYRTKNGGNKMWQSGDTVQPAILLHCDPDSVAALRISISKVCLHKSWPLWQRLEKADAVLKVLGLPAHARGRKGKT